MFRVHAHTVQDTARYDSFQGVGRVDAELPDPCSTSTISRKGALGTCVNNFRAIVVCEALGNVHGSGKGYEVVGRIAQLGNEALGYDAIQGPGKVERMTWQAGIQVGREKEGEDAHL